MWDLVCRAASRDPRLGLGCGGWTQEKPSERGQPSTHAALCDTYKWVLPGRAIWDQIWQDVTSTLGLDTMLEVYSTLTAGTSVTNHSGIPCRRPNLLHYVHIPFTANCKFHSVVMIREAPSP